MKQFFFSLFLLFITTGQSQLFKAKIISQQKYPWSILYQIKDIKQIYVENKQPDSTGVFTYDMKGKEPGEYFLLYDLDKHKYFYFVYNNENVNLKVYPEQNNKIKILESVENKTYLPFSGKRDLLVHMLDDLEKKKSAKKLSSTEELFFEQTKKNLDSIIRVYSEKSKGLLVHSYIINSGEYYPDIHLDNHTYFKQKLSRYFESFDFNNPVLRRSKLLLEKLDKYVFSINPPLNPTTATDEYMKRIAFVLSQVKNQSLKNNIILYFIQSFVNVNGRVSKKLIETYYYQMPETFQNQINIQAVLNDLGLLEGEKAPDFSFSDLNKKYKLYDVKSKYTLLIFWSATCPHCLRAMPKIYNFIKDKKDFKVVAIGLENGEEDWMREHYHYPEYIHGVFIDSKNKWGQPIVKKYHITATPTFFILDAEKKILAKPYETEDVIKTIKSLEKDKN